MSAVKYLPNTGVRSQVKGAESGVRVNIVSGLMAGHTGTIKSIKSNVVVVELDRGGQWTATLNSIVKVS